MGLPPNLINAISILFAFIISNLYLNYKYPITIDLFGIEKKYLKKLLLYGITGGVILILLNSPFRRGLDTIIIERYLVNPKEGHAFVTIFLIIVVVLVPIIEEIYYRAFIFRIVGVGASKFWSFSIASILFSAGHGISLSAFLSSLILCFIFEKAEIVGPCIIAHILWNLVWFGSKYYMI